jgi:hypothetical protein
MKELTMKGLLSTLFVLSLVASGVANAQPRGVSNGPADGQVNARQSMDETSRSKQLYYGYSEDVSNVVYWSTPQELGGGAAPARTSGASGR